MNFWNLLKFAISQTPERALAILRDLRPSQWKMFLDGVRIDDPSYSFALMDAMKARMLVVDIIYADEQIRAMSKLKNDGSDSLTINGVAMTGCDFEFHSKPLQKHFVAQLGYKDADGLKHVIEMVND